MFVLAILIIIYSYCIFSLGVLGLLYKLFIIILTIFFILLVCFFEKKQLLIVFQNVFNQKKEKKFHLLSFTNLLLVLLVIQAVINLVGALGPELGFDALWYHLTLPKIFLQDHSIRHIPGGLFYYSDMPKLMEMLYVGALSFGTEILAKIIHFLFGIGCLVVLYNLSKKYMNTLFALLVCVIFYSNLVVGWESITAYIDLGRTFFEILAFFGFVNFIESKEKKWFVLSAVMLGCTVSSKLLSIASLGIFWILIVYVGLHEREQLREIIKKIVLYSLIVFVIPLPWFIFSFLNTGNPVYPFFSPYYPVSQNFLRLLNPLHFIFSSWNVFTHAADPLSPIYIIFLPLVFVLLKKFDFKTKIVALYSLFGFIAWYITPDTGGGRFILSYLPAFSLLAMLLFKYIKDTRLKTIMISVILFTSIISIGYRAFANKKYIPVILHQETKQQFLSDNLNFSFGDFYDVDNFFHKTITAKDRVLLYGFHNEFYIDFPFIDASFVKPGDQFDYIATQNTSLPKRFWYWNLVYENDKTGVKLYTNNKQVWEY